LTAVITDDDLAYVLDTVAALHQIELADLRFDFHVGADSVLHLINRDPITAMVLHVVAPTHTPEMLTGLQLRRFDAAGLRDRRRCTECITSRTMLFDAITEYDVALSAGSLAIADAMVYIPDGLEQLVERNATFEAVIRFTDVYDTLVERKNGELEHLADPSAFVWGDVLTDAYRRIDERLAVLHAATLGSDAMRSLLRVAAVTYGVTAGDDDVLVEIGAINGFEDPGNDAVPVPDAPDAAAYAAAVQYAYAPHTRDDHSPVVLPEWAAAVIAEHAGHRIRSRVFTGLGAAETDTAIRLWEPYGSGLYRSLEHCVNAAVALR
jgi:hypothetical protein